MTLSKIMQLALFSGLGALVSTGQTHAVTPRYSEAVQPRHAEAVQPRHVEATPPRQDSAPPPRHADAVQPRYTPPAQDTAVVGQPNQWRWQEVGHTGIAGPGVARGSQLKNIRCAGVACRVYEDTAGAWTIRAEGGFPDAQGRTLEVLVMDTRTGKPVADSRYRGVFSDGNFWDQLTTWELPVGSYAVFYHWGEQDQVLAAVTFDALKHASASTSGKTSKTSARPSRSAVEAALQNQRCLAMQASNPDVRCVQQQ